MFLNLEKLLQFLKKEDEQLFENYRPISTLPIFGKIFEKLIYERLYNYFVSKGILYDRQFGFRKSHSTSHALNFSVDHIRAAIKNGNHVLGIFIDFRHTSLKEGLVKIIFVHLFHITLLLYK